MNDRINGAGRDERDFREALSQKLRAPLNAIIGFAELLMMRPRATTAEADLQHILISAREMLGIINHELGQRDVAAMENDAIHPAAASSCDVLYVEDDFINFTLVERILELRPALRLMHAQRGETGLEMAQAHRPKLILLDLNLPDIHGADVLQRLQADRTTAQIPVVVLSADATPSQIERLLKAGAHNYLTKPFDIGSFLALVDDLVSEPAEVDAGLL